MNIILDTNIIRGNFLMSNNEFDVLFDYLKKTDSKIIVPEVVYEEVLANYGRLLGERFKKLKHCVDDLNSILTIDTVKYNILDIEKNLEEYKKYFEKRVSLSGNNKVVPLKDEHFKSVVKRAIAHKKPCSAGGRGFRDSLIWLTALDMAKENSEKTIGFVSNNTKDFASDDKKLHKDLLEEADSNGVNVKYYDSIGSFIKGHAVSIDFISTDWLNSVINIEKVNKESLEYIESHGDMVQKRAEDDLDGGERLTGYQDISSCDLAINNFYIYEKTDGSFYVNIQYRGEAEAEVEIETEEEFEDEEDGMEMQFDPAIGDFNPVLSHYPINRTVIAHSMKSISRETEVIFGVIIKDKKIVKVELESVYI